MTARPPDTTTAAGGTNPDGQASRVDVLGTHVDALTFNGAIHRIVGWVDGRKREYATFATVHGIITSLRHPQLQAAYQRSALVATDGMPLVWCCRLAGVRQTERVYGPDVLLALSEVAAREGLRSYLLGGAPGVADVLAERLSERYSGLDVVGTRSPPFRELNAHERTDEIIAINSARPDIVWVGLGTPKQEAWMADRRPELDAGALLGVGAAFDFHAGMIRQAPEWMQQRGLEWAFRLAVEPRRLWRRYLRTNPEFVARVLVRRPRLVRNSQ